MATLSSPPIRYPAPEALFQSLPFTLVAPANRTLLLAVLVSMTIHASLLTVNFAASRALDRAAAPMPLEVVLVNARTVQAPAKADAHAQVNLDGGGNTDARQRAKTPLPQSKSGVDVPEPAAAAQARVAQLEAEAQRLLAQVKAQAAVVEAREPAPATKAEPQSAPQPAVPAPSSVDLAARSLEMARLRAELSQSFNAYQERPRKHFIGARTKEYRFARYVEDWRSKVERVGNINYPDEARRQRLYGSLLLTVSIRRDGSVESIEINRSSGFKLLDQAAIRIVELAAPFAPFPPDIQKDTDILAISRTWSFTSADQFQGQ